MATRKRSSSGEYGEYWFDFMRWSRRCVCVARREENVLVSMTALSQVGLVEITVVRRNNDEKVSIHVHCLTFC